MTRTIPTRLTHPKFNQLLEWSRANSSILQNTDRVELATMAEQQLGFPIAASTFILIGETMGVTIGRRVVNRAQKAPENDQLKQLEHDVTQLAFILNTVLQQNNRTSHVLDAILARRSPK